MKPLSDSLWSQISTDLQSPGLLGQLVPVVLAVAAGWGLARLMRRRLGSHDAVASAAKSVQDMSWVLAPLLAAMLLFGVRFLIEDWHRVTLITTAIALLTSFGLIRAIFYVLRAVFTRNHPDDNFLLAIERFFALLVWLGAAIYITGLWPALHASLDGTLLPLGRNKVSVLVIVQASVSVIVTLVLALWIGALVETRLMVLDTMHSSLRAVLVRTIRAVLVLVAVLLSLSLVGIDLTVLSVFGGALGVGLGLGLQKIVSSYFSGFVILLERSLALGDVVKVEQFQGKVSRINARYTVLQGLDGVETVVPNEMLVAHAVQNNSLSDRRVRLSTHLTVGYETDIEILMPLLASTVAMVPRVSQHSAPQCLLLKFGVDGLELEIGFWMDDHEIGRNNLISEVNQALWRVLKRQKIAIPYPQRDARMVGGAPNEVLKRQNLSDKERSFADKA